MGRSGDARAEEDLSRIPDRITDKLGGRRTGKIPGRDTGRLPGRPSGRIHPVRTEPIPSRTAVVVVTQPLKLGVEATPGVKPVPLTIPEVVPGVGFWLAWGALALGMVLVPAGFREAIIDDAYITFRYARNLVDGAGLVFNPGERVEGYTSLLWTLLAAGLQLLEGDVPRLAQFVSVMCNLLLATLVWAYGRRKLFHSPYVAMIAPLFLLANLNVGAWAAHGMETSLFTLLLTLGVFMAAPEEEDHVLSWDVAFGAGLLLAAACWTRPEGILYGGVVLGLTGGMALLRKAGRSSIAVMALTLVTPVALLFAWRYSYYGEWLPNTFYAKATGGAGRLEEGARYLLRAFDTIALGGLLLVPLIGLSKRLLDGPRPLFFLLILATAVYALGVGGDAFAGARFFVPVLPLLYLLVQDGLSSFFRRWKFFRLLTALGTLLLALYTVVTTGDAIAQQARMAEAMSRNRAFLGQMLDALLPPGSLIALNTVGALPYYAQRPTLDLYGLTDVHIARMPLKPGVSLDTGHEKGDGDYVLRRRPDLILMRNVWVADVPIESHRALYGTSERELMANPAFLVQYRPVNLQLRPGLQFGLYLRADHDPAELQARFQELNLTTFGDLEALVPERWLELSLYQSGLRLLQNRRPEMAVRDFERALEIYPDAGDVHLALAQAQEGLNVLDKAEVHYTRATELLTESSQAWLGLGNVMAKGERSEEAIRAYQRALVADPNLVDAYANIAAQYLKQGKNADAIPFLKRALTRSPRDLELWVKLGGAAGLAQKWSDAREALERATQLSADDPKVKGLREWLLARVPRE